MPLIAEVESLDTVPEGFRGEYEEVEGGGRFRLKVEGAEKLVDTSGLKSALDKERKKGELAEKWAKRFPGKTPDEIAELLEQKPTGDGKPPLDTDKLKAKWRQEFEEEVAPKLKELDETKARLRTYQLDEPIKDAALKAGVFPEQVGKVVKLTRDTFDLNEKGEVVVLDKDGYPSSVSLEKYFAEVFKKDMPMLYKAPEVNGSGSRGADGKPALHGVRSRADLKDAAAKAAFIEKNGLDAFKALPAS